MNKSKIVRYTLILGAVCAPTWQAAQWLLTWIENNNEWLAKLLIRHTAIERTLTGKLEINEALWKMQAGTEASRAILFKSHNGGRPAPNRPFHSSILEEVHKPTLLPMFPMWQDQYLDYPYLEFLLEVYHGGAMNLVATEMKAGIQKDIYIAYKIAMASNYRVLETAEAFYYVGIMFPRVHTLTANDRSLIRAGVSTITRVLRQGSYE